MAEPTRRRVGTRLAPAVAGVLALAGVLGGCAGGSSSPSTSLSPADALSQAEQHLTGTSGITLSLSTDTKPAGESYLTSAQGTITDAPAFSGTATGQYKGLAVSDVGVVSVGGTFEVQVPISGWQKFDPKSLCAPDPAQLLSPDTGIPSLLSTATDPTAGGAVRGGTDNKETLTPYTATVPGDTVRGILPCSKGSSYDATFDISTSGYLRSASVTGDFSGSGSSATYTITVSAYDVTQDISLP